MKSPAAYYLLLIYFAAMCKPIMPFIQDFVAHSFFKYGHIRTVHHQNGKDHVHYELGKMAKETGTETDSAKGKNYDDVPLHFPVQCQLGFNHQQQFTSRIFYDPGCHLPAAFTTISIPPPRS